MKAARIIDDYAIAGAMALLFWIEPIPTFDLDVLIEPTEQNVSRLLKAMTEAELGTASLTT